MSNSRTDKSAIKSEEEKVGATCSITSGAFPLSLFRKWEDDCISNFGNCRWMKMWSDHLAAKQITLIANLAERVEELERHLESFNKEEKDEEGIESLTLGGGRNGRRNGESEEESENS